MLTNAQIDQLVELLVGMTPAEWSSLKIAVDKEFNSMSCKLVLHDTESLKSKIKLEAWD